MKCHGAGRLGGQQSLVRSDFARTNKKGGRPEPGARGERGGEEKEGVEGLVQGRGVCLPLLGPEQKFGSACVRHIMTRGGAV